VSENAIRWRCETCGEIFHPGDVLTAANPFDANENVTGCPSCKAIDSFAVACDDPGCPREATCGCPTENGYRSTCWEHAPIELKGAKP
jgi:hypothetical protein